MLRVAARLGSAPLRGRLLSSSCGAPLLRLGTPLTPSQLSAPPPRPSLVSAAALRRMSTTPEATPQQQDASDAPAPAAVDPAAMTEAALRQFVDPYELDPDTELPGRRWRAAEIRLKSNEDLQKLWVVLMRERNMLQSAKMLHRVRKTKMPHPERIRNTRKSMAMIKVVLGERAREKAGRDARLHAERVAAASLSSLDLPASSVWPTWVPGTERTLTLARETTFTVALRWKAGGSRRTPPPPDALRLTYTYDGEPIRDTKIRTHRVHLRPAAPSRPLELTYECSVHISPGAIPSEAFGAPADAAPDGTPTEGRDGTPTLRVACELYGEVVGPGEVDVRVRPSASHRRRAYMARVNRQMRGELVGAAESDG